VEESNLPQWFKKTNDRHRRHWYSQLVGTLPLLNVLHVDLSGVFATCPGWLWQWSRVMGLDKGWMLPIEIRVFFPNGRCDFLLVLPLIRCWSIYRVGGGRCFVITDYEIWGVFLWSFTLHISEKLKLYNSLIVDVSHMYFFSIHYRYEGAIKYPCTWQTKLLRCLKSSSHSSWKWGSGGQSSLLTASQKLLSRLLLVFSFPMLPESLSRSQRYSHPLFSELRTTECSFDRWNSQKRLRKFFFDKDWRLKFKVFNTHKL